MASEQKAIDITDNPAVIRLVDEVQAGEEPRVLRRGDDEVAIIVPLRTIPATESRTTAEQDAIFFSSFGAWRGLVDAETLTRDIYAARGSNRPAVEL